VLLILRIIYNLLTLILSLVLIPFFLLHPRGRPRLLERFGFWKLHEKEELIWIHAASVGELNGLKPILTKIRANSPKLKILVSATTTNGLDRIKDFADYVRLLPFDNFLWLTLAARDLKLKVFIFSETELWPELLQRLLSKQSKIVMLNATISDYSWNYFKAAAFFFKSIFPKFTLFAATGEASGERLKELGAKSESVFVLGNSKFDLTPSVGSKSEAAQLKSKFFSEDWPTLVLGSLRPGEERIWFPAFASAFSKGFKLNLVIAPRHVERVQHFCRELERMGLSFRLWSSGHIPTRGLSREVLLLDTLGDLESCYSFAEISFIGGTLTDWGGHNPLEAAAYGSFILMGPFTSKVSEIAKAIYQAGGGAEIRDQSGCEAMLEWLAANPSEVRKKGEASRLVFQRLSGVSERVYAKLKDSLGI